MREIRFRAWDKERGYFHWGASNICLTLGGNLMWQFGWEFPNLLDREEASNYILMQYTGLKDKNGKEIYEGDILKYTVDDNSTETGTERINKVVFHEGAFCYIVPVLIMGELPSFLCQYNKQSEIIGNAYENPELLKDD